MNEGGNIDSLIWENNEEWSFFNWNDDLVSSGWKFADDQLPDLNRSDTCQPLIAVNEVVEATTVDRKRKRPNQKKDSDGSGEAKSDARVSGKKGDQSNQERRKWMEREKRKQIRNLFKNLHALIPQLPSKANDSTIVDEAVKYIKILKGKRNNLILQKLERLQHDIGLSKMNNPITMTSQELPSSWEANQGSSASNSVVITPANHNNNNNVSVNPLLINNSTIPTNFETWISPNVVLNVCGEEAQINVCCPKKPQTLSFICHVMEKHNIEIVSAQVLSDYFRSMIMIQAHARSTKNLDEFSKDFSVAEIYQQAAQEVMAWITPV